MGGSHKCVDKWKCKKCTKDKCCPSTGIPVIPFGASGLILDGSFEAFLGFGNTGEDIAFIAPHSGTLRNLFAKVKNIVFPLGGAVVFTIFVNGVATALSVSVTSVNTVFSNTTAIAISAGSEVSLLVSTTPSVSFSGAMSVSAGVEYV